MIKKFCKPVIAVVGFSLNIFIAQHCIATENQISNSCSSMTPLLQLFPQQHNLAGQPEFYRGCKDQGFGVELNYGNKKNIDSDGKLLLQYKYVALVLNGNSSYVQSYIDSAQIQKGEFRGLIGGIGNIFISSYKRCKHLAELSDDKPAAVVRSTNGLEVCVSNNGSDGWTADALYKNDIFLRIELSGTHAPQYSDANGAAVHLLPLFALFNL